MALDSYMLLANRPHASTSPDRASNQDMRSISGFKAELPARVAITRGEVDSDQGSQRRICNGGAQSAQANCE
ncbi:MAG TPA: hypothetical protein VFX93_16530, partial [Xanthomonadaceae bacterium]|nr:hypothetical protein [Xanthomonadaceae bacterium]